MNVVASDVLDEQHSTLRNWGCRQNIITSLLMGDLSPEEALEDFARQGCAD